MFLELMQKHSVECYLALCHKVISNGLGQSIVTGVALLTVSDTLACATL